MHIVIPMSGRGERFVKAGYKEPKPFIEVDGRPIVQFLPLMFPGETKFTFILSEALRDYPNLEALLRECAPQCQILFVEPHKKGPVWTVDQVSNILDDREEVIVNYCDFYSHFDYQDFLKDTRKRKASGAVLSYKGFHPHMLGTDNYAFMQEKNRWMLAIQEKKPFTDDRMSEYASTGTYYFASGRLVKRFFRKLIEEDVNLNGEYYVSLIYNLLVQDQLKVSIYEVEHMLQWGTPKDLEEYKHWSAVFRSIAESNGERKALPDSTLLIPLAGKGQRFVDAGYQLPKPLLEVNSCPMVVQAAECLPDTKQQLFACLASHLDAWPLAKEIQAHFPKSQTIAIDEVTEGQAITCERALSLADPKPAGESHLLIGACDNGMIFDQKKFCKIASDPKVDAIAFSFRNNPASIRNPHMYGWLQTDGTQIKSVSVKKAISDDPAKDHAIVGAFYFRTTALFLEGVEQLRKKNVRVNGEFYVDSLIGELVALGYNCHVFEVDSYICWGTPNDLKTFQYWQEFFHKCQWHPYL